MSGAAAACLPARLLPQMADAAEVVRHALGLPRGFVQEAARV